jgi:hypothetical protein
MIFVCTLNPSVNALTALTKDNVTNVINSKRCSSWHVTPTQCFRIYSGHITSNISELLATRSSTKIHEDGENYLLYQT